MYIIMYINGVNYEKISKYFTCYVVMLCFGFFAELGITNIKILDGVTSIGNWAFDYCSNLATVVIPDSVEKIGKDACEGCYNVSFTASDKIKKMLDNDDNDNWDYSDSRVFKGTF